VRALACVPQQCVIGVTESVVSAANDDDDEPPQSLELVLWSVAGTPGTILHKLDLQQNTSSLPIQLMMRRSVFGLWLFPKNDNNYRLVVAARDRATTTLACLDIGATNGEEDGGVITVMPQTAHGIGAASAAAAAGQAVVLAEQKTATTDIVWYNHENLSESARETLSTSQAVQVTALAVQGSGGVVAGCSNGKLVRTTMQQHHSQTNESSNNAVNCSTAPPGLQGMLCPNLTVDANQVQLQNQCIVQ